MLFSFHYVSKQHNKYRQNACSVHVSDIFILSAGQHLLFGIQRHGTRRRCPAVRLEELGHRRRSVTGFHEIRERKRHTGSGHRSW